VVAAELLRPGDLLDRSWLIQNPSFSGYAGAFGYLPSRRISIAATSTQLPGADVDANVSSMILERIAAYLTPETPAR
jgi:D-alanyl-D-alanine carboxypeptidase